MVHNHTHTAAVLTGINRSFLVGITLNVVYVLIELYYGWQQSSTALLSDAVHNISDISGLLLAFVAFRLQAFKPTKRFTYGFKRGSIVASFVNAVLLALAIGGIAWGGIQKIIEPGPVNGVIIIWVAAAGVIINFISALLFRKKQASDLNIKAAYWHLMADALVSLGVVISGILIYYFQWYVLDGISAIVIAFVVLIGSWRLFKDSLIAMLDGIPTAINRDELLAHLVDIPGIREIHHLHIWGLSTNKNALTAHIVLDSFDQLPKIKARLKAELAAHDIDHSTFEFELINENCQEVNL